MFNLRFKFIVQINNGKEIEFLTTVGLYNIAAEEVFKMHSNTNINTNTNTNIHNEGNIVKIWMPSLVENFGPYRYKIENEKAILLI